MILHALELTFRDLGVGLLIALMLLLPSLAALLVILLLGAFERRADRRHDELVERNRAEALADQRAAERRTIERRRERMHSYNARPTAAERWGGRAA